MSVFTPLSAEQAAAWLEDYALGTFESIEGIAEGVQNSNFFLQTTCGHYVLTIFEQPSSEHIDFHMQLLDHLAARGIPCPAPIANRHNQYLGCLAGKPAAIVRRLPGRSERFPNLAQCAAVGAMLAELHLAARSCPGQMPHQRDAAWCARVAALVAPFLADEDAGLLHDEVHHQLHHRPGGLPRGVIHADLFRDNVLFDGDRVSGLLDFYFAGVDDLLFDLAVTVNDWCSRATGELDDERSDTLLTAYDRRRPLQSGERTAWPTLLRAAALRFWISRLHDRHLPRSGDLVIQRDPGVYRSILQAHRISGSGHAPGTVVVPHLHLP